MKRSLITIWMLLVLAVSAWAHGDEQHVMGTVLKIDGMRITVKTQDGSVKTVMVTSETKYLKAGSTAKLEEVKVGDRVVIHAKKMGDTLHATQVKIGVAKTLLPISARPITREMTRVMGKLEWGTILVLCALSAGSILADDGRQH